MISETRQIELTELRERMELVRELHARNTGVGRKDLCVECSEKWPCATIRILDGYDDPPYVCPGCHAVAEKCLPGCIDEEIRRANEERDYESDGDND